jgi:hypothetical protein
MRKSTLTRTLLAGVTVLLVAAGVMAQGTRSKGLPESSGKSRAAIIAVGKENKLEFAGDKAKVMRAMQQAFEKVKEREVVKEMSLRLFGKLNYLAVSLEGQGDTYSTLFFELASNNEGTAFHTNGPHVVTCVKEKGCSQTCVLVPTTSTNLADCYCPTSTDKHSCNFKINKTYLPSLITNFNELLLADGFTLAPEEGATKDNTPNSVKPVAIPGRKN